MSRRVYDLKRGDSVFVDGSVHLVWAFAGTLVMLRSGSGREWNCPTTDLVSRPDFRPLEAPPSARATADSVGELEVLLPQAVLADAEELLAHLYEMRTGYRSGYPEDALPGEPRADYDIDTTTESQRAHAKAGELAAMGHRVKAASTLRNLWAGWKLEGLVALVDKRHLRALGFRDELDDRVSAAAEELFEELKAKSDISLKNFVLRLRERLDTDSGEGEVRFPARTPRCADISKPSASREGSLVAMRSGVCSATP